MAHLDDQSVIELYKELEKHDGENLCNKRRVDAALVLENGDVYRGTNGYVEDPCTRKGQDHCMREKGIMEYVTCPSPCSELSAMLNALNALGYTHDFSADSIITALFYDKVLENSALVTTDFPCDRCKSIIIDAGVAELYFGNYKKGRTPRFKDASNATHMALGNVKVHRIMERTNAGGEKEYKVKPVNVGDDLESFIIGKAHTSGEAYIRMLFDPKYREYMTVIDTLFYKENPFTKDMDPACLIFPDTPGFREI